MRRRRDLAMASTGIPARFAPHEEPGRPVTGPGTPSGVSGAGQAGGIIGYKIGGHVYHPSDVVIIRRCKP